MVSSAKWKRAPSLIPIVEVMKIMELFIEMETILTEMIKPSTPTPPHLKSYRLSMVDQLLSLCEYSVPLTFFYTAPRRCNNDEGISIITRLKESLSKTLTLYYPIAGRLVPQESTIICNDAGVPLVVARANCSLFSFLNASNRVEMVSRFIPRDVTFLDPTRIEVDGLIPAVFQFSIFNCGGFALGILNLNKAMDGTSLAHFLMTWAAIATGDGPHLSQFGPPDLTTQTRIFPPVPNSYVSPQEIPPVLQPVEDGSGGCIVKPFVFTPANVTRLQDMARSDLIPNPTRIESVTCFLWKHFMAAAATASATVQSSSSSIARQERLPTITGVILSVNIRPHLRPMLPPTSFGMFVTEAFANSQNKEEGTPTISDLVVSLREALSKTKDNEWLNKFRGEGRIKAAFQQRKILEEFLPKSYLITDLRGFDQLNFGSGAPVWIGLTGGRPSYYFRNYVPLIHTNGHRIEAWPILDEKVMEVLESDQEFLSFAIPSNVASFIILPKASL